MQMEDPGRYRGRYWRRRKKLDGNCKEIRDNREICKRLRKTLQDDEGKIKENDLRKMLGEMQRDIQGEI
jgi:hypothetical protein